MSRVYSPRGAPVVSVSIYAPGVSVSSISPTTYTSGNPFTLTVNGAGFQASSVVRVGGVALTTTFVSSVQLTAAVTAAAIPTSDVFDVDVATPATPDSNTTPLTIDGDANFAQVVALLHFQGADGSTTFTDTIGKTWNVATGGSGDPIIDTAQFKWGSSSLELDGNDAIGSADSADWAFGSGDFTIEAWVRFSSITGTQTFINHYDASSTQRAWSLDLVTGTDARILISIDGAGGGSARVAQGAWPGLATNTWFHVAGCRSGNTMRIFVNGAFVDDVDMTGLSVFNSNQPCQIGVQGVTPVSYFSGWIGEIRVTKGFARYTGAFTPPTMPFANTL